MALNPSFPNYANSAAGTEVIGWTVVGGQPLYRLPTAYVNTGFGAAFVCEGSTTEGPTFPEGVYVLDPGWESAGTISGVASIGQTLTFTPGTPVGTAPLTVVYNWIRYIPGGQSVVVGSGLNYTTTVSDQTHQLIVQSVVTNSLGSVATQTVPFGPIVSAAPVITNAGSITSVPPNPVAGGGAVSSVTVNTSGANYIWSFGATRNLIFTGDGSSAVGTANLNPAGTVVSLSLEDTQCTVAGGSGQITFAGEGSEVDLVADWVTTDPSSTQVDPAPTLSGGTGWTQANLEACFAGTYGTITFTGTPFVPGDPTYVGYVGCGIQSTTITTGGSGYTVCGVTVEEVGLEVGFPTPPSLTAVLSGSGGTPVIYPGQLAVFSGATVTGFNPQVSWVWGYGPTTAFTPIQLGGTSYRVSAADVNKEIFVYVTATNTGGTVQAYSIGIPVSGSAPIATILPKIGPQEADIGTKLTGAQGRWSGYPTPQVTDWGFATFLLPTPTPIPSANKVYTFTPGEAYNGQRICFYVTATNSEGTTTAYSTPTDALFSDFAPDVLPNLTGFQSPAQTGDVVTGTPGTFIPQDAYKYSYFASKLPADADYTEISGTRTTNTTPTTYTLQIGDQGKDVVFRSYGEYTGSAGYLESATTTSPSTGRITTIPRVLTAPTITYTGAAPEIGSTVTLTRGTTSPTWQSQSGYPENAKVEVIQTTPTGQKVLFTNTSAAFAPQTFTIPLDAANLPLRAVWTITYKDAGGTGPTQMVIYNSGPLTPAVVGGAPVFTSSGSISGTYQPGQTLTYTPPTATGNPTPVVAWTWQAEGLGVLQTGGLTYTLGPTTGIKVGVVATATNRYGTDTDSTPFTPVGPAGLPIWTRLPVITGSNLVTPTQTTTLSGIPPIATNPDGSPVSYTWAWYKRVPGQQNVQVGTTTSITIRNDNGINTGLNYFIAGTATNTNGTAYIESNLIQILGTPRIISEGFLSSQILPNVFRLAPCSYDGGGVATTSEWSAAAVINGQTAGFIISPAISTTSVSTGSGTANGSQSMTNSQGTTSYNFPQINVQFV